MQKYDAVFIDLDGTLLGDDGKVSSRSLATLERVAAAGVRVVISTGRPIPSVRRLLGNVPFSYSAITLNGTVLHADAHGQAHSIHSIDTDLILSIWNEMRCCPFLENIAFDGSESWYSASGGALTDAFADMYNTGPSLLQHPEVPQEAISNIVGHVTEGREELEKMLTNRFGSAITVTTYSRWPMVEVTPRGRSKGTGLVEMCDLLKLQPERVVAFGDAENDVEMLLAAGLRVVMDNAIPSLHALGHRIAPPNHADGVASVLDALFPMFSPPGT